MSKFIKETFTTETFLKENTENTLTNKNLIKKKHLFSLFALP